jgi:hypothetical protein
MIENTLSAILGASATAIVLALLVFFHTGPEYEKIGFREGACTQLGGVINGDLCIKGNQILETVKP